MRATAWIALVGGAGLLAWAVVRPQPVLYLCGAVLVALTGAVALATMRRTRAEEIEGRRPASCRARWAAGALGTGLGVLLAAVLVAVPFMGRWLPAHEGVIWRNDITSGGAVVDDGRLYMAYWQDRGPGGTSVQRIDLADGTAHLSIPGHVFLTQEGDIIAHDEQMIRYYDPTGQQLWAVPAPDKENATTGIFAAEGGYVLTGYCGGAEEANSLDCHFVGLDPSGAQAWTRNMVVDDAFMASDDDRDLLVARAPLPVALSIRGERAERALLLEPSTGEPRARYRAESLPSQEVYGDVLVVAGDDGSGCTLDAYRLSDGGRAWHLDDVCTDSQLLDLVAAAPGAGRPSTAYIRVQNLDEDVTDHVLAVNVADGSVGEVAVRDLAGHGTNLSSDLWSVQDAVAGGLVFRWSGTTVTAASAADGQQQWQVDLPGTAVRNVVGNDGTVGIVTFDDGAGHNPFLPPPREGTDSRDWPAYVTVVDAPTGDVISTTRFGDGLSDVVVPAPHQAYVQGANGDVLVGEHSEGR